MFDALIQVSAGATAGKLIQNVAAKIALLMQVKCINTYSIRIMIKTLRSLGEDAHKTTPTNLVSIKLSQELNLVISRKT